MVPQDGRYRSTAEMDPKGHRGRVYDLETLDQESLPRPGSQESGVRQVVQLGVGYDDQAMLARQQARRIDRPDQQSMQAPERRPPGLAVPLSARRDDHPSGEVDQPRQHAAGKGNLERAETLRRQGEEDQSRWSP